ncbi:calpain-1 catalytic subunit-like [Carassius carassius]|uniref:calpain-1 catalytic subunit-like n=1 Tax=Carassius carassius TaxID=217509 RepID=UPI00286964ED|nr:calpain-1 catalytic subunit-like [Carassius carassius]XP_059375310.1 calpain-1 catalytic subunit-like [Carassius carassius]
MPPPRANKKPRYELPTKDNTGTLHDPLKFLNQDYQELRKSCITNKKRFDDDKFPPDSSSIDPKKKLKLDLDQIKWLRPSEIATDPQLIVQGVSRFDYSQGCYLGNCWFLASVGALTFQKDIMDQVMPTDQSFDKDYAGIFHFRFWRFGKWIDVVIDDKLPTINGELIFVLSKTSNEFWPALLEKAYAKVCGSYADMNAGQVSEALLDFTGGVHVCYDLQKATIDLWSMMDRADKAKALMACNTHKGEKSENVLPNGIVQGHAYTVTGVFKVTCQGKPVRLVRVLNPWGMGEWNGAWSDNSSLWDKVSEKEKTSCRSLANDGEFWMSMEDFTKNFEDIDICCLSPDFLDSSSKCSWSTTCYNGSWECGSTAGGCSNNKDSFWTNPQFRVRIEKLDEECASGQCLENILVSLIQIHENRYRSLASNYSIGFSVYLIPPWVSTIQFKLKSIKLHNHIGFAL